ncbi:hypothetical protein GCM10025865_21910 [Paraoerskovia sediminicola]|uniref:Putative sensor domain-containing protein n=1 Tax=Paraoerskovia sediminicola TaxID=1138587 RepID=A0ABN6XD70_9CELL|nr:hypothetical protein GCM10025865_21910 [Paraoerskovia sediminicola]
MSGESSRHGLPRPGRVTRPGRAEAAQLMAEASQRLRGGLVAGRTWRELAFLLGAVLLAPVGLAYGVLTVVVTAVLAITVVGLYVGGWMVVGARGWGRLYRGLARRLLDVEVEPPRPSPGGGASGGGSGRCSATRPAGERWRTSPPRSRSH